MRAGRILALDAGHLYGWAALPGAATPPVVEVLVDGAAAAHAPADLPAGALAPLAPDRVPGDGAWAFAIALPADLLKTAHRIEARLANTAHWLGGALTIDLAPPLRWTHGVLGHVASDGGPRLTGWALDPRQPLRSLPLRVHVDGSSRLQVIADRHEPWLAKRGIGSGFHGFEIDLPPELLDGAPHRVVIEAETGDGEPMPVPGSPVEIRHLPACLADLVPDGPARAIAAWYDFRFARSLPAPVRAEMARTRPRVAPPERTRLRIAATTPGRADVAAQTLPPHPDPGSADIVVRLHPALRLAPDAFAALARAFEDPRAILVAADHLIEDAPRVQEHERIDPLRWWATGLPAVLAWRRSAPGAGKAPARFALERPDACRHLSMALGTVETAAAGEPPEAAPPACLRRAPCGDGPARLSPAAMHPGRVSIVIPSRDRADLLAACLDSIADPVQPHEILVVDNGSIEEDTLALHDRLRQEARARILPWDRPFNFADLCNAGAEAARGEILLFLNNDVVFPEPGWIAPLVSWLTLPGVGAVGNKLVWPNGIVQHAGVRVGPQGLADHIGTTWWRDEPGPDDLNRIPRFVDAVTAACLAMPAALFRELGGFDGYRFPVAFNDVDLCLRVQQAGHRIVWTPEPWAHHLESASRGDDDLPHKRARMAREAGFLRERVAAWQAGGGDTGGRAADDRPRRAAG